MQQAKSSNYIYGFFLILLIGFLCSIAVSAIAAPDTPPPDSASFRADSINTPNIIAVPMDFTIGNPVSPEERTSQIQRASVGEGINWEEIAKGGIGTLVLVAVMLFIVKPLIKQMVDSNNTLAEAVSGLREVISTGNANIANKILESERNIIDNLSSLKDDITSIRVGLRPD